jgi:hypothetical protein
VRRCEPIESLKTRLCMVLFVMFGAGCTKTEMQTRTVEPAPPAATANPETLTASVTVYGALREIMHMGRSERRNACPMSAAVHSSPALGTPAAAAVARRQQLLHVAEELSLESGYGKTSVSRIVKTAGVAQGTFYLYFASKEARPYALRTNTCFM